MSTPPITFPDASAEEIPLEEPRPPAYDPDNPPWGLAGAVGLLILSFVLMLLTQVLFLIPYTLWRGVRLVGTARRSRGSPRKRRT